MYYSTSNLNNTLCYEDAQHVISISDSVRELICIPVQLAAYCSTMKLPLGPALSRFAPCHLRQSVEDLLIFISVAWFCTTLSWSPRGRAMQL